MNAVSWRTGTHFRAMAAYLDHAGLTTRRKLLLFAAARCRHLADREPGFRHRGELAVLERQADLARPTRAHAEAYRAVWRRSH